VSTGAAAPGWVGRALPRVEDPRFLRGRATYLDDLRVPGTLHVALLRSPHAHARLVALDAREARAVPGIAALLTGNELAATMPPLRPLIPIPDPPRTWPLAVHKTSVITRTIASTLSSCVLKSTHTPISATV